MFRHRHAGSTRRVDEMDCAHSRVVVVVRYTPPRGVQYCPALIGVTEASAVSIGPTTTPPARPTVRATTAMAWERRRGSRTRRMDQG
jgi:hypothetical protein